MRRVLGTSGIEVSAVEMGCWAIGGVTSNGRTLTQGALAWIWGKGEVTVPIPGFKTTVQVRENAGAMAFGPSR